ncbi:hypothetical protein P691DRAFT_774190 [Macrolepiota fuliginosa MF-IS2]|uniref:NACHT domain-containing protein n=1 Tax=Macrolepiota fuliginosa MF-IS2 TaxID=1400762 RepID=A0A9P5XH21_9AGAR|nr:hypothetical protein P691DRAFT_774190 [Macrolepiota fuliginosa MF-IS2]
MPTGFQKFWSLWHSSRHKSNKSGALRDQQQKQNGAINEARDDSIEIISGSPGLSRITRSSPTNIERDPYPPQQRGCFANAHHNIFHHTKMVEHEHVYQYITSGRPVLEVLEKKCVSGAEIDSSVRYPLPKCHPDTRQALRTRIITWLSDPHRHWHMFWITGPAGVGKSAVAQTIAEYCRDIGQLGAAFFFSREHNRNDSHRVIPTLVRQLTMHDPDYKMIITERLADDSTTLDKNIQTQFRQLITEPFAILRARRPSVPVLILLDGLDECNDEDAQCEFVELISQYIRLNPTPPVLWMICSRPESHLKNLLRRADYVIPCKRETLPIDDTIAQQDVYRYLWHGFHEIRVQYIHLLDIGRTEIWPPEAQLRQIAGVVSGLFILADLILKFVGDKDRRNPQAQLNVYLNFTNTWGLSGGINPFRALDLLYIQIMTGVHRDILPTTLQILSLVIFYLSENNLGGLTCSEAANFLGLDLGTFYCALDRLHSVLDIPPVEEAAFQPLRLFHSSFGEFLCDPDRSGPFALREEGTRHSFAIRFIRWCNYHINSCNFSTGGRSCAYPPLEEWMEDIYIPEPLSEGMISFVWTWIWKVVVTVKGPEETSAVLAELHQFDFCWLTSEQCSGLLQVPFMGFLRWLFEVQPHDEKLLRLIPGRRTDQDLLNIYDGGAFIRTYVANENEQYHIITLAQENAMPSVPASGYISIDTGLLWLGCDERACLVVAYIQTDIYVPKITFLRNHKPVDQIDEYLVPWGWYQTWRR